ncbi:hypothetical protein [Aureibacter tunicatorum]|uniref:SRPBCC family protein n=1 Tax=Aureibacter tunicatorum TaxID=866807 RepID=A0AAE3XMV5_9BACT|nr:hypothetical protein [Aureibacter tunicatorum]MDR6238815.1 hypothetical protein [Aureibacter tunicatorum]
MKVQKPNRKSYSYQQVIHGSIDKIMPLYCPVRELDWCENWQPNIVISNSGIVEKDCIFTTNHGDLEVVWVVTEYDIAKGLVEMYYHVPKTLITKLSIQVQSIDEQTSQARLTYTKTALSPSGDKVLEKFTKEGYDIMMDSWEKAMNHYLKTGEMLTGLPNF